MPMSPTELARCTEAAGRILESLGIAAYQFAIEPRDGQWDLLVECSADDGWRVLSVPVERAALASALDDDAMAAGIREEWALALGACRSAEGGRAAAPAPSGQPHA